MNILGLLYQLKANNILLWHNNENISFSFDKQNGFPDALKEQVKANKLALLTILKFNSIDSETNAKALVFYKIPDSLQINDLSPVQKGIYLQCNIDKLSHAYNVPIFIMFTRCQIEALERAVLLLLENNPILRMTVNANFKYDLLQFDEIEYTDIDESDINLICKTRYEKPFDINGGKLIQTEIMRVRNTNKLILNLTHHHILSDAYSVGLIIAKVIGYYQDHHNKIQGIDYFDYIPYLNHQLHTEKYVTAINHLSNKLDNAQVLQLDENEHKLLDNIGQLLEYKLDLVVYKKLSGICTRYSVSIYAILLTSLYHVLSLFSGGKSNFPIGLTVSNRPFELNEVVGPFISTLPLIPDYEVEKSFIENIQAVNNEIIYLNEYRNINLNILVEKLKRDIEDVSRLMRIMFTMHNFQQDTASRDNTQFRIIDVAEEVEKFGISIVAKEEHDSIRFHISYACQLYNQNYIRSIMQCFMHTLSQINDESILLPLTQLNFLSKAEYQKIIYEWNKTDIESLTNKPIQEIIELYAEQIPDQIALICGEKHLTYRQINNKANQLACHLKHQYQLKGEDTIGVLLDQHEDVVIGLLAVLKAGCAYVPLSLHNPENRIKYILNDTKAKILLTHTANAHRLSALTDIDKLFLDDKEIQKILLSYPTENLSLNISQDSLAYIMYTSGTQGNPKGVMIEHKSITSLVCDVDYVQISNKDRFIQLADVAFDAATFEIWGALLNGASLYIPTNKLDILSDVNLFKLLLQQQGISILWLTKTLFDQLFLLDESIFAAINYLLVGGEALNKKLISKLLNSQYKPKYIINGYGPTENTTFSCTLNITTDSLNDVNSVPIGKPLANRKAFVLNDHMAPLPLGAMGELYVGGSGVARGYLNSPDLTNERFIANPFQTEHEKKLNLNNRLYKTGDLVRWLPNGNLEYIGRGDSQFKIRGYRIELSEIEHTLLNYPGISQCALTIHEHAEAQYLAAYYVSANELYEADLRAYLDQLLPDYMVPSVYICLAALPLTINGKLDVKALPNPLFKNRNITIPRNRFENIVQEIWSEVLGLEQNQIDIHDNFFHLGGNSILAIMVTSKINTIFKSSLKARDIFQNKTIDKIASLINDSVGSFAYEQYLIADSVNNTESSYLPFSLTNVQQAYLLGRSSEFGLGNISTHIYNEHQFTSLNIERLTATFNLLLNRHLALRTVFIDNQQHILKEVPYYDIKIFEFNNENEILKIRNELSHKIYKTDTFPLFDVIVSKYQSRITLHLSFDALLMDAQSFRIFFDEWTQLYKNPNALLPNISITYRDYIMQYMRIRESQLFENAKQYWIDKLDQYSFEPRLPIISHESNVTNPTFTRVTKKINKNIWNKLLDKSQEAGISTTVLLLWVYGKVLCFWSGEKNICINLTLFNRLPLHPQINQLAGDFTVLELFNFVDNIGGNTIAKELQNVHEMLWNDIEHNLFDGIDFQRLIRKVKSIPSNHVIAPVVFTSILGNTSQYQKTGIFIDNSYLGETYSITQTSQVWLDNKAYEINGDLIAEWDYVKQLFDQTVIDAMHEAYCHLIEFLADADWHAAAVPSLSLPDIDQNIIINNNSFEQPVTEHTLFSSYEHLLKRQPQLNQAIAVIEGNTGKTFTYTQLLADTQSLASHLVINFNTESTLIGVLSEKGYNQVVATLSIMKSGQGYLPLHIEWPLGRIDAVLQQGNVKTVLLSSAQYAKLEVREALGKHYTLLVIEDLLKLDITQVKLPDVKADDVAYVIFTSGSTGVPKGVTISHRGALNTIDAINHRFNIHPGDKILALSELSFDLSVYDIFGLLAKGGTIVFPDQAKTKEPQHWLELINKYQISLWNTVPQLADLLIDEAEQEGTTLADLRLFLLSGDWIPTTLPDRIKACCPGTTVMSLGGATEGSIWSIWYEIDKVPADWSSIPYGVAMPNQKMYVLSPHQEHCPMGVMGEIHIGGLGVALNYFGDKEKTANSFIDHKELGRLYKTGDLGKWHRNGYIEFAGRKDNQLKIRGYRVELGEIEHALISYNGIKQAVVVALEDRGLKNKYLTAYYVAEAALAEAMLLDHLRRHLPEYMVPSVLIHLTALPLSANGKVDLKALPHPELNNKHEYIAPRTELETEVTKVWSAALGLKEGQISIRDDFFSLGGDSIISIQLASKLRQQLGIAISIQDIFAHKNIEALCKHIASKEGEQAQPIQAEQGILSGEFNLLPIQQWFFSNSFTAAHHWNQSFLIRTPGLEVERLKDCFTKLVAHHDAFRLRYRGQKQFYQADAVVEDCKALDINSLGFKEGTEAFDQAMSAKLTDWQSHFDIENGPLYCIGYLHGYADGSARIFFALHHLLVDTVSWRILTEDLQALYAGQALGDKTSSYRQWVTTVEKYAENHQEEQSFWEQLISDFDFHRFDTWKISNIPNKINFSFNENITKQLLQHTNKAYHTNINDILLTALAYALTNLTENKVHHISLEGHGREPLDATIDSSRTLGWFTTLFPIRLEIKENIGNSIKNIKESLRAIPNKGIGYGSLIGYKHFLPKIGFNYLGQIDPNEDVKQWVLAIDMAGRSISEKNAPHNLINIGGAIIEGKLKFELIGTVPIKYLEELAQNYLKILETIIIHCSNKTTAEYTKSDFYHVESETNLAKLPLLANTDNQHEWFAMTEIQKVYLLGRLGNYEIGNVSNHVYHEYYYKKLDINRLERIINQAIKKYPVLRTIFSFEKLQQRFLKIEETPYYVIEINDFSSLLFNDKDISIIRNRLSHKVYDPEKFPLFTFEITQFKDYIVLHISTDLILLDAHSRQSLFEIINQSYRTNTIQFNAPNINFKDYQDYYQLLRNSRWYDKDKTYWKNKIPNMPLRLELPFVTSPEMIEHPKFTDHTLYIDKQTWSQFKSQARKYGVSYSSVLLGLYGTVLSYFSGYQEFLITMTLFNRYAIHPEVDQLWGDFTSTNLFHFIGFGKNLLNTLKRTHDVMWNDIHHALYTGMEVQRELAKLHKLDNSKAVSPIVFTGLVGTLFDELEANVYLDDSESIEKRYWSGQTSQAWIDLQAIEAGGQFMSKWLYVDQLFNKEYIATLNTLYCNLIKHLATNDWEQDAHLFALPAADQQVIERANHDEQPVTEHTLFSSYEHLLKRQPQLNQAIAVIEGNTGKTFTYAQLLADTQSLASHLVINFNTESTLIGVLSEKGYNQVVATLSIMKSGQGYLPLHIEWPLGRIDAVLQQGNVKTVLLSSAQYAKPEVREALGKHYTLLVIEDLLKLDITQVKLPDVKADDVAYVIFTSGSTGVPKGVTISHRGALNTIDAINHRFNIHPGDKILALSELSFDLSVYDIFGLLAKGGTIVFPDQAKTKEPQHWLELINKYQISLWNTVPQLADLLIDEAEQEGSTLADLRLFLLSGDWIPTTLPDRIKACCPGTTVMSLGGATEGSIWSIWYEIDKVPADWSSIPYGVAMPNQKMYVLSPHQEHCPMGVMGEIHIGGLGVALNYFGDNEKTANSFIDHKELGRLYKTGDLGKWHRSGYIEFAGRKDNQLKIRGYRVELGEIEHALISYNGIKQAVVVALEDRGLKNKYLTAYYVAEAALAEAMLLDHLRRQLPEYMVPSVLIHLTALPLSANGKVDLKALPHPELNNKHEYIAPRTELETEVTKVWSAALGLKEEQISIRDDFFSLGGDSIISIQLASKLRQQLGIAISIQDIFTHKNIEALCKHIASKEGEQAQPIQAEQGILSGEFNLLPIQQWFFTNSFTAAHHWNQSFLIRTPGLEVERLKDCFTKLVAHHDAFRLRYRGQKQFYQADAVVEDCKVLDINSLGFKEGTEAFDQAMSAKLTDWQSHFNIKNGPLYCIGYLHGYADGSARIFFALHHLLVDTVSWRILTEDLQALYAGQALGDKTSSYRQWVTTVDKYAENHQEEKSYWQSILKNYKTISLYQTTSISDAELTLDKNETYSLLRECNTSYHTQINDLLLTAFGSALADLMGNKVNHVLLEGHGREILDPTIDTSRTLGWFTTLFPICLEVKDDIGSSVKNIKEMLRAIPNKGIGYGSLIGYKQLLPKVSFNYLGQLETNQFKTVWALSSEMAGTAINQANQFTNDIGAIALIVDNCLSFKIFTKFGHAITNKLTSFIHQQLNNIIQHCLNHKGAEYTASDFAAVNNEGDLVELPLMPSSKINDWFEMTEIQKVYLLGRLSNYEIGNIANHIYNEYSYQHLDVNKLEKVINQLIIDYPVLRTVFSFERLQQRFLSLDEINYYQVKIHDFSTIHYHKEHSLKIRDSLSHKVYDPEKFSLFTFEVSKFKDCDVLHISIDLILLDAHSRQSLFSIMNQMYRDENYVRKIPSVHFKDYQDYYQLLRNSQWYEKDKAYWSNKLANMPLRLELPFIVSPDTIEHPQFTDHTLYIEEKSWSLFKAQARKYGVSYSSVLLGLYGSVLSYFSGCQEFLITMTLFNRYAIHPEVDQLWGDFTSTNLFHFAGFGRDLLTTLKRTHDVMWNDIHHALYTGMEVQRELARIHKLNPNRAVSPIVFTGIVGNLLDETDKSFWLEDNELVEKRYWSGQTSQAWIDLQAIEAGGQFMSKWLYVDQLFNKEYIATLNTLYCNLIKHLATNDWEQDAHLFALPAADQQVIERANHDEQPVTEHTLFSSYEHLLKRQPQLNQAIAVIEGNTGKTFTYTQLLADTQSLASHLVINFNTESTLIGVLSEKGYNQVVATLSIMKSGQGYLPLHIEWPLGRIDAVLQQGNVKTVLLSSAQYAKPEVREALGKHYTLLVIEDLLKLDITQVKLPDVKADDVAYVIFTSGSTGVPKGVTISHRGALNTIDAINHRFNIHPGDKILALSELSFDLSVYDIFGLLAKGGTIVFPDQAKTKEPQHWLELINKYQISLWNTVPQLADLLIDEAEQEGTTLADLRLFLLSGDWIPTTLPDRIKACCPGTTVMSLGGATEGSIWSIWYEIDKVPADWSSIPYGVAMPNQKMYVLSPHQEHCPMGVMGEIHIGGLGVALNYFGDNEKTANSFIEHKELGRLYKTGDLGKWHRSGYIEFAGRKDNQLKIRGYRVELGEIEHALISYNGIKQAVVVALEDRGLKNKYLTAYYVAEAALAEAMLLDHLRRHLPEYMVPSVLIHLTALPLSANGKVDLSKLPQSATNNRAEKISPSNEIEKKLCSIWATIIGIEQTLISVSDNFFDLGGNSLLIIRLKSKIEKELGIKDLALTDIFRYTNISDLAQYLNNKINPVVDQHRLQDINEDKQSDTAFDQEIAVIAMTGAFPHAKNIEEYWQNLADGKECLDIFDKEQCRSMGVSPAYLKHEHYMPVGGLIDDIDKFDHAFWNFSFNDALLVDPQIRKFMECSWQALEQAGHIRDRKNIQIGVFAGMSMSKYYESRIQNNSQFSSLTFGIEHLNEKDYLTTRISYMLGLTGPSININTACSTSLVAIVEACKNLAYRQCDVALAGGVSFPMPDNHGYIYQQNGIFAEDGHCRVFDKNATGTVGGAGIGIVVLKRLKDAIRDKNNIIAIVKGYAINNDGDKKVGYTAPSIIGQAECILQAQKNANVTADTISYVECHGTGTSLGDPIEIAALHDAFSANSKNGAYQAQLGAVKANIGHAASAAGVAGFIKICSMLQTKTIPPQINYSQINPTINIEQTGFQIPTSKQEWLQDNNKPRRAAVSSFGFGGTNAHVILEEYNDNLELDELNTTDQLFFLPISAKSIISHKMYCAKLAEFLEKSAENNLASIAYTLQHKREHFAYRNTIVCSDRITAIEALKTIGEPIKIKAAKPNIIMMFSGQGSQYPNMAHSLYLSEPVFKQHVDHCCELIFNQTNINFKELLYPTNGRDTTDDLLQTQWSQPALFTVCYSLAKLCETLNIEPKTYIGHSIGEYVAATLTGVFDLETAIRVVIKRGELMQKMPAGSMLSVNSSMDIIETLLPSNLTISLHNSPNHIVISGDIDAITHFNQILVERNIRCSLLHTSHAFHSEMMKAAAEQFESYLQQITFNAPTKPFISNLTGQYITDDQAVSPSYWAAHIRQSIQFSKGIQTLINTCDNPIFLEIGPGKTLTSFVKQHLSADGAKPFVISTIMSAAELVKLPSNDVYTYYQAMGQLWSFGYPLNWNTIIKIHSHQLMIANIPTYQFEQNKCWIPLPVQANNVQPKAINVNIKDMLQHALAKFSHRKPHLIEVNTTDNHPVESDLSHLESQISLFFSEILGNAQISKHESFFDLGGTSLSALNLITLIKNQLKTDIVLSTIYQHSTIAKLAKYLNNSEQQYQPIIRLNEAKENDNLFMVHPGLGGCQVYKDLAVTLSNYFCCYGVDSYNLYHYEKIKELSTLAHYYLSHIKPILQNSNQKYYHLLGWSLGGLICLEMAAILENEGYKNITVYLLDTIINDNHLASLKNNPSYVSQLETEYLNYLKQAGYNQNYIDMSVPNIGLATKFENTSITSILKHTKVILFKAMRADHNNSKTMNQVFNHAISLQNNNLDKLLLNPRQQLKVIQLHLAHHNNILEQTADIKDTMLSMRQIQKQNSIEFLPIG